MNAHDTNGLIAATRTIEIDGRPVELGFTVVSDPTPRLLLTCDAGVSASGFQIRASDMVELLSTLSSLRECADEALRAASEADEAPTSSVSRESNGVATPRERGVRTPPRAPDDPHAIAPVDDILALSEAQRFEPPPLFLTEMDLGERRSTGNADARRAQGHSRSGPTASGRGGAGNTGARSAHGDSRTRGTASGRGGARRESYSAKDPRQKEREDAAYLRMVAAQEYADLQDELNDELWSAMEEYERTEDEGWYDDDDDGDDYGGASYDDDDTDGWGFDDEDDEAWDEDEDDY